MRVVRPRCSNVNHKLFGARRRVSSFKSFAQCTVRAYRTTRRVVQYNCLKKIDTRAPGVICLVSGRCLLVLIANSIFRIKRRPYLLVRRPNLT